jgi:hypothetical protein
MDTTASARPRLGPFQSCPAELHEEGAAMRVGTYRNESRSRHFDLTGRSGRRWSIDLVAATASCILLEGFACSLVAVCVH